MAVGVAPPCTLFLADTQEWRLDMRYDCEQEAEAFRTQQADFESDWNVRGSRRWSGDNMRCTAFYDMRLKPLHEISELCGERLNAQRSLWPVDEPRCDLTHVRHQNIRVSVSVTLRAHDEQFSHWSSQSAVCVGRVKRQRTTEFACELGRSCCFRP